MFEGLGKKFCFASSKDIRFVIFIIDFQFHLNGT
jgi:hypothetical protein